MVTLKWASRHAVGAVVGAVLACSASARATTDDDNFRPEVLACEDAMSWLTTCCAGFRPRDVSCHFTHDHHADGCGNSSDHITDPALSYDESRCIISSTCESLVKAEVCARAQRATPYESDSFREEGGKSGSSSKTHPPVCP